MTWHLNLYKPIIFVVAGRFFTTTASILFPLNCMVTCKRLEKGEGGLSMKTMRFTPVQTLQHHSILRTRTKRKSDMNRKLNDIVHFAVVILVACWSSVTPTTVVVAATVLRAHSPYLYVGDAYPIIEYILSHNTDNEVMKREKNQPSFLYDTDQGYRIVEFYSSRTEAIALRLRDSYIQLASTTTQIIKDHYPNITFDTYAVCCTTVPSLCETQGIDVTSHHENVPVFMMYKPGSSVGQKINKFNVSTILDAIDVSYDTSKIDVVGHSVHIDLTEISDGKTVHLRTIAELKADIHLALYTFMKDHVFVDHDEHQNLIPLSTEKRTALKKYLLLIHKSIPPSWPVRDMVRVLIDSFMYICKNRAYLVTALEGHSPEQTEYSTACQIGMSHVSGLTCGAWEMIHAVTVGIVEHNKMALSTMELQSNVNTNFTTMQAFISNEEAAVVLRNFVHHFGLGDNEMERQELIHHFDVCKDERCLATNNTSLPIVSQWIKLPLYISKVHSTITLKRQQDIAKENHVSMTALEQHIIAMWPPKYACPQCWDEHGKWDTNVVYKYLQLEYTDLNEWSLSSPEIRLELLGAINKDAMKSQSRHLASKSSYSSYLKTRGSNIVVIMQQIVVLFSALGIVLYRATMFQQQKQQAATLILPQTIWTKVKVQRNKSFKQNNWLSHAFDHKKS